MLRIVLIVLVGLNGLSMLLRPERYTDTLRWLYSSLLGEKRAVEPVQDPALLLVRGIGGAMIAVAGAILVMTFVGDVA